MAIQPLAIGKPGSGGLNTQEPVPLLEESLVFASVASNAIIGTTGLLEAREDFVLQTSGGSGTFKVLYIHTNVNNTQTFLTAAAGIMYASDNSGATLASQLDYRQGAHMVDVGGAKAGATATGLANSAEVYGALVSVDGGANQQVSITGSTAQTYTDLLTQINADLTGATASLVAGNVQIKSASTGASSSVVITNSAGTASNVLFSTLTNFAALRTQEAGTAGRENWQFASLNGEKMAVQAGNRPRVWPDSSSVESAITYPTSGTFLAPNVVMAAWGRFLVADDSASSNQRSIWWSNLLTADFTGGDSGTLDLTNVWPDGSDRVVALGQFSGRLVIFGRNSIVMYQMPADLDPTNMTLLEPIRGVGCISRDSVVNTGDDLLFLSDQGVMSLARLTTVASLPVLSNFSKNVQDDILASIAAATLTNVRAGYNPRRGWYMVSFPDSNKTYCLNLLSRLTDKTPRATTWTNTGMPFWSFVTDNTGALYTAGTNGIRKYTGFTSDGASQAYTFSYWTPWLVFGDETVLKLLKWVEMTVKADSGQTGTLYWREDYVEGTTRNVTFTCSAAEFAEAPGIGRLKLHVGGAAVAVKFGVELTVAGDPFVLYTMRAVAGKGKVI
jgi:hypothetical protein